MSGLHAALRAQRDTTRAQYEASDHTAFMSLGAVADLLDRLLDAHPDDTRKGGLHVALAALLDGYDHQGDCPVSSGVHGAECECWQSELGVDLRALLAEHPPADLPVATGDAGTQVAHVVHVTAMPVAEDAVWCDTCREWVIPGAPERATSAVGSSPEDAGERVALSEDERSQILLAYRDGVLAPGEAVLIEVERILAGRLAPVEQERDELQQWRVDHCMEIPNLRAHAELCEQEAATLREQVAAVAALRDEWDDPDLQLQRLPLTRSDVVDRVAAALADPASVLAQRDAEVIQRAVKELRQQATARFDTHGGEDARGAALWDAACHLDPADGDALGLRQGVDRG